MKFPYDFDVTGSWDEALCQMQGEWAYGENAQKALARQIEPKVYAYGFLKS